MTDLIATPPGTLFDMEPHTLAKCLRPTSPAQPDLFSVLAEAEQPPAPYAHLDDPAERAWLTNVKPQDVLDNAHRMYDFMAEGGMAPDSYTRELAFEKAAAALGIDYDVLYDAWVNEQPAAGVNA